MASHPTGMRNENKETDPLIAADDHSFASAVLPTFLGKLRREYGWRLLVLIFVCLQMSTGFVRSIGGKNGATLYLLRDYDVPAAGVQMYQAALNGVWTLAPAIGLMTDVIPINGYNKAPYVLIMSVVSLAASATLWLVPQTTLSVKVAVACIFILMLYVTTNDTCVTGAYTQRVKRHPAFGADLAVYVSMGIEACGLLAGLLSGVVIADIGPKACYGICVVPIVACIIVTSLGFFDEQQATAEATAKKRQFFWDHREVGFLSILMCFTVIFISVVNIQGYSVIVNGALCLVAGLVLLVSYSVFLTPTLAKMSAFAILFNAANISVDAAMFYFYTDDKVALSAGPHFTPVFYNSVRAPVWSASAICGIYLYKKYMKQWTYRTQAVVSNTFFGAALLLDLVIVARANLRIGLSDSAFFLMSTVAHSITYQWQRMPFRVCFMYLCPNNMETTVIALLNGCSDFGGALSLIFGAVLLKMLQIDPNSTTGDSTRIENLPKGIVYCAIAPILATLLFQHLIPDAVPNEHLVDDAVAGSFASGFSTEGSSASAGKSERMTDTA